MAVYLIAFNDEWVITFKELRARGTSGSASSRDEGCRGLNLR